MTGRFSSRWLLFGLIASGILSVVEGTVERCEALTKACSDDSERANGLSPDELERIFAEWRNFTLSQEDNDKICKQTSDLRVCLVKLQTRCGEEQYFQSQMAGTETRATFFNCVNGQTVACARNLESCVDSAIGPSYVSRHRFSVLRNAASEDRKYLIAQIGRLNGCALVTSFAGCYDRMKGKCSVVPITLATLDATEAIRVQLRCEQAEDDVMTRCDAALKECKSNYVDVHLIVDQIVWAEPGMSIDGLIAHLQKYQACQFVEEFQDCYQKGKTRCGEPVELYFKPISDVKRLIDRQLRCNQSEPDVTMTCAQHLDVCRDEGSKRSSVAPDEVDRILKAAKAGLDQSGVKEGVKAIGRERGCEFVDVFTQCHANIQYQCGIDDPNFKPLLEITRLAYEQLKCGCAHRVASLLLVLASVFLAFCHKIA